ncbi:MAG: SANT/Myb-like DNA-binding domain-containing protein [Steroidobacteraceae bacterium]
MSEHMNTLNERPAPRRWTKEEEQELVKYTDVNTPNHVIASKLGRTSDSVRKKIAAAGLSRGGKDPAPNGDSPEVDSDQVG